MTIYKKDCNVHYEVKLKYYPVLVVEFEEERKIFPIVDDGVAGCHDFDITTDYDGLYTISNEYLCEAENKIHEIQNWINETCPKKTFVDKFINHIKNCYETNPFYEPYHYLRSYFSIISHEKTTKVEFLKAWKFKIRESEGNNGD